VLFDKYKNYQMVFYTAAALAAAALLSELAARPPDRAIRRMTGNKVPAVSLASRRRCSEALDVPSYGT
jgi:transposase InsO family protein